MGDPATLWARSTGARDGCDDPSEQAVAGEDGALRGGADFLRVLRALRRDGLVPGAGAAARGLREVPVPGGGEEQPPARPARGERGRSGGGAGAAGEARAGAV